MDNPEGESCETCRFVGRDEGWNRDHAHPENTIFLCRRYPSSRSKGSINKDGWCGEFKKPSPSLSPLEKEKTRFDNLEVI